MSRGVVVGDPKTLNISIIFLIPPKPMKTLKLCELKDGKAKGKPMKIIPIKFPSDFIYAKTCDDSKGQQVEFDKKKYWLFWRRANITDFNPKPRY